MYYELKQLDENKRKKVKSGLIIFAFFFLYIILPDYFALEISESLPLFTASRLLIVVLAAIILLKERGRISLNNIDRDYLFFLVILLIVNFVDILSLPGESIKTIFSLLLENWFLSYLVIRLIKDDKSLDLAITGMVFASIFVGIMGILETITGVNVFYFLTTTQRKMLQSVYLRLGSVRASGPFGHAIYFGTYQVCMIPFSLYLYDSKKKLIFFMAFILNIVAVILSGSRGQIAIMFVIIGYLFIKKREKYSFKYIKNILFLMPALFMMILIYPEIFDRIVSLIESTIQAFHYSGGRTNNEMGNANGILSRIEQWSGIIWTFIQGKFLFGFGNKAHMAYLIKYFRDGVWTKTSTFDVGYVAIFCQYGILGTIAYFKLYFSRLKYAVIMHKRMKQIRGKKGSNVMIEKKENLQNAFIIFYICYLLNLLTCTGVDQLLFIVIALQIVSVKLCNRVLGES